MQQAQKFDIALSDSELLVVDTVSQHAATQIVNNRKIHTTCVCTAIMRQQPVSLAKVHLSACYDSLL